MGVRVRYSGEVLGPEQRHLALIVLDKAAQKQKWRALETLRADNGDVRGHVFQPHALSGPFAVDFGDALTFEGEADLLDAPGVVHPQVLYALMTMKFIPNVHTRAEDETGFWNRYSMAEMYNLGQGRAASHRRWWWPF